ncbi:MAG: hypothetical protein M1822_002333 [Bathelium mastoideum]|nr:MAG: hypothetical protein M1822_002333 [Bathelium mastoideum]
MSQRPNFIDLRSASSNDVRRPNAHLGDLPSPRAGEVPPALSPLDAFALASRTLAKRFDEKQENGRRISRLPHLDIANEFGRPRPGYFRADSGSVGSPMSARSESQAGRTGSNDGSTPGLSPNLAFQPNRPISQYPLLQNETEEPRKLVRQNTAPSHTTASPPVDYFNIPRSSSPEAIDTRYVVQKPTPPTENSQRSGNSYASIQSRQRGLTTSTTSTRGTGSVRLAPPYSPQVRSARSPSSVRSGLQDSGDDYDNRSLTESDYSRPRKLSGSSAFSESQPPSSPYTSSNQRPPSVSSDYSIGGTRVPRSGVNFSRPISRSGISKPVPTEMPLRQASNPSSLARPSLETLPSDEMRPSAESPYRQDSGTASATPYGDQHVWTPLSNASGKGSGDDYFMGNGPAPSYIYAKYSLPRGRTLERDSVTHLRNSWLHHFHFDTANVEAQSVPSTPTGHPRARPAHVPPQLQAGVAPIRSQSADDHYPPAPKRNSHRSNPSAPSVAAPSVSSTSTIKPTTHNPATPSATAELTPQEHLDKGIQLHSDGRLTESTYHLRRAALAGLPTAMLLYALACRHGWGMRAAPSEGITWLRKAVDGASLEVADDPSNTTTTNVFGAQVTGAESKARKAQFALGIYELGVSYMNGWGVAQDRALALRCFEIAGSWGDVDALAEAGFCYTEGIGCRKDLRKAARFYRRAEAGGMSMTGNSWIYKDKYMDDAPERPSRGRGRSVSKKDAKDKDKDKEKGKKPRDKSRSRGIFSRRKHAPPASETSTT